MSYPISLQFRPATRPYCGSTTVAAAELRLDCAFVNVVLRVPVMSDEKVFTAVVAVLALELTGA